MPKLKALRQICGDYGNIAAGQEFEVDEETAAHLETLGVVEPRIVYASGPLLYSTKVITPEAPEVGARPAFRDVPVRNAKPSTVAAEGDPVLSEPDVPAQGAADSGRWAGRKRSGAGK